MPLVLPVKDQEDWDVALNEALTYLDNKPAGDAGQVVDLFMGQTGTLYISHRLGGGQNFPENSFAAARETAPLGFPLETDCQLLVDGTLAICHDPTVDRTLTGSGSVAGYDLLGWRGLRHLPSEPGLTVADEPPPTFMELLDLYGGKHPLLVESKDSLDTADRMISEIRKRGLQRAVMITSFELEHVQFAANAGLYTMLNDNAPDPAALAGLGITYVSMTRGSVTPELVQDLHSIAGVKVAAYTINQRIHRDAMIAAGVDAIVTEEPFYIPHDIGRTVDPYRLPGVGAPGHTLVRSTDNGTYDPATKSWGWPTSTGQNAMVLGWASPVASDNFKVRFTIDFKGGATDQTRWASLYVCLDSDDGISEANGGATRGNGYSLVTRRDGTCAFYRIDNGVATKLKSGWTGAPAICADEASEGTVTVEVEVSPTTIYFRRLNSDGSLLIESNTTDTIYRGGRYLEVSQGGTPAMFHDFTITPL